jgi:hypothetical protein
MKIVIVFNNKNWHKQPEICRKASPHLAHGREILIMGFALNAPKDAKEED